MMALTKDADIRLVRAIRQRWPDRDDRAEALELSTRQLNRWELDGEIPKILTRLIELGVIAIIDAPVEEQVAA